MQVKTDFQRYVWERLLIGGREEWSNADIVLYFVWTIVTIVALAVIL